MTKLTTTQVAAADVVCSGSHKNTALDCTAGTATHIPIHEHYKRTAQRDWVTWEFSSEHPSNSQALLNYEAWSKAILEN